MAQHVDSGHSVSLKDSLVVTQERHHVHMHVHTRKPAFGAAVVRFGRFTQHPHLDRHGLFAQRPQACDPCRYYPRRDYGLGNKTGTKEVWRFKQELEDWAANLGYRNPAILKDRALQKTLLGPAWYDPKHMTKKHPSGCLNVGFGSTPRFKVSKAMATPPPGTYYRKTPFRACHQPHSKRPSFEREELCRFKNRTKIWSIAPNRYMIRDSDSIAEKPKKIVSLRGPYDLTSGPRILVQKPICPAATWPLTLPGSFDTYKKSHFGVMNKSGFDVPFRGRNALVDIALSVRRPGEPGPADQNIDKPREFKECKYAFNSSNEKPVGYTRARVWPAVGRYNIINVKKEQALIPGKGHTHIFNSKVQRTIGAVLPKPMNTF